MELKSHDKVPLGYEFPKNIPLSPTQNRVPQGKAQSLPQPHMSFTARPPRSGQVATDLRIPPS